MATGPRYRVVFKRRRLGKTNYRRRLKLLASGTVRAVVRRSNKYVYAQLIESNLAKDRVVSAASSRELIKLGYPTGLASSTAAYLTGLLLAKRGLKDGIREAVLDIGVISNVPKSNTYAFLKGCVDGGLEVPHSKEMLPDDSRLNGEHIANYAATLKSQSPQKYSQLFSKYLSAGVEPENIKGLVTKVKQDLDKFVGEKSV
jgi:large subunit ribosomal protein L18